MKVVDLYARVRRACHVEGMSQRQAARVFGIDPKTVAKMLRFAVPPGYRRSKPPVRPKLDPLLAVIDGILEEDQGGRASSGIRRGVFSSGSRRSMASRVARRS